MIFIDESNSLSHYGVLGMHWGVRKDGKPQGFQYGKDNKQKNAFVNDLSKTMDSFEYGTIINGKRYSESNLDKVDWDKYRTLPISTVAKEKIGNCWDFVNYQHSQLDKAGIENKNYMFVTMSGNDVVTHTFTIIDVDGQKKWLESALWKKHGIHDVNSPDDVVKELTDIYDSGEYDLYEYNPDGMDQGLSGDEFFARATVNGPINVKES